eukprot:13892_1
MNMTSCLKSLVVLFITYHSSYAEIINCPHVAGTGTCSCDSSISGQSCQLKCGGIEANQCYGDKVICRNGDDCTITCDGYRQCYSARITCPSDASCIVQCLSGTSVCGGTGSAPFTIDYNNADSFTCQGSYCPSAYLPYANPTLNPTPSPIPIPTIATYSPTKKTTSPPTTKPTHPPSNDPTIRPTPSPTKKTHSPTRKPSRPPTTSSPTPSPTRHPTRSPTTRSPTPSPTP